MSKSIGLLLCTFFFISVAAQQVVEIRNSSFEDIPYRSKSSIRMWQDCGAINFPAESPPDIHPGKFWGVNMDPSHGSTYLGLVVRDNDTWEGISQRLLTSIQAGTCYEFNIDLARSQVYESYSRVMVDKNKSPIPVNFTTPAVLRIWGGAGLCDSKELLAESIPITHSNWETYPFKIKPRFNHNYILIEAYYKTPVMFPYCGHLLLDNLSNITEVPCEIQKEEEVAAVIPTKPKSNNNLPPHKRARVEKAQEKLKKDQEAIAQKSEAPKKKKVLEDLDIKKLKKGSTLEIKNLYFAADAADINEDSYEVLDEIYDFLKEHPSMIVEIGGHTNRQPKHDYCDRLSTARAKSVYDYLINKGIAKDAVTYKGYGKRRPISVERTAEGRKRNQRVEIKILSLG